MKEDLFDHYNIYVIPSIINELQTKLQDSFSISPILIDFNDIILYNAKSPPKSKKLNSPMSMDSNDSQFNTKHNFDVMLVASDVIPLNLFIIHSENFNLVNEFEPIFKFRNLGKSFIINDSIEPKLSSPISNDSNNVNRDISNIV